MGGSCASTPRRRGLQRKRPRVQPPALGGVPPPPALHRGTTQKTKGRSQDGGRPSALATSTMLMTLVLMPFPRPSICGGRGGGASCVGPSCRARERERGHGRGLRVPPGVPSTAAAASCTGRMHRRRCFRLRRGGTGEGAGGGGWRRRKIPKAQGQQLGGARRAPMLTMPDISQAFVAAPPRPARRLAAGERRLSRGPAGASPVRGLCCSLPPLCKLRPAPHTGGRREGWGRPLGGGAGR